MNRIHKGEGKHGDNTDFGRSHSFHFTYFDCTPEQPSWPTLSLTVGALIFCSVTA